MFPSPGISPNKITDPIHYQKLSPTLGPIVSPVKVSEHILKL